MIFRLSRPVAVRTALTFAAAMTVVVAVGTTAGARSEAATATQPSAPVVLDVRG